MRLTSVRVRLTLWNVTALALILVGFAVAAQFIVKAGLSASVDQELRERASSFARRVRRYGPPDALHSGPGPGPPRTSAMPGDNSKSDAAQARRDELRPRVIDQHGRVFMPSGVTDVFDSAALAGSIPDTGVYSTVLRDGAPIRVFTMRLPQGPAGSGAAFLQVAYPLADLQKLLLELTKTLLTLIPFSLVAAGLGGLILTDRTLRPVRQMRAAAQKIGARDLSSRLEVRGDDEFSDLASTFNRMIARLERAFEQQQQFIADASHELRTPLTTIKGTTSLALSGQRKAEDYRRALEVTDKAADSMSRVVQDLLLLARSDSGEIDLEMTPVAIGEVLEYAASAVQGRVGAPVLLEEPPASMKVCGDMDYLVRLFVNLLGNAIRHTPPEGRITLSAHVDHGFVVTTVADTGEGIPAEHLPHLGERFYRVDKARQRAQGGAGLGLAICQSIVQAHGGSMEFQSVVGQGTTVTVRLPAVG